MSQLYLVTEHFWLHCIAGVDSKPAEQRGFPAHRVCVFPSSQIHVGLLQSALIHGLTLRCCIDGGMHFKADTREGFSSTPPETAGTKHKLLWVARVLQTRTSVFLVRASQYRS